MKKAKISMAAIVCHPETGEEFGVRHQVDVQEWLDLGYTLKGEKKVKKSDDQKVDPAKDEKKEPEKKEPENTDTDDQKTDPMTDEEFFESVKDKLQDLSAADAKRVAVYMDVEYTNKRDTMAKVEDKLAAGGEEDL